MKKILSLLMSLVMLFSCVGVIGASAQEGYIHKNEVSPFSSIEEIYNESVYGVTVDFLYNSISALDWSRVTLNNAQSETLVTLSDFALMKGNINTFLKSFFIENYLGELLLSEKNATLLTNLIGNLFYPDYENKTVKFPNSVALNDTEFFTLVVKESGLDVIIQNNWCYSGIDFMSFMVMLGVNKANVLEREYIDGEALGVHLLKGIYRRMIENIGPVNYLFEVFNNLKGSYNSMNSAYAQSINALFALRLNTGKSIETITDVLNMIFNGMDPDRTDAYQFAPMPLTRMQMSTDATENLYYIIAYTALNYKYKNNAAVVSNYLEKTLPAYLKSVDTNFGNEEVITNSLAIQRMMKAFLTGDLDKATYDWGHDLSAESLNTTKRDLLSLIKNSIAGFFKRIAEWFDNWLKVFSGEKEFGKA